MADEGTGAASCGKAAAPSLDAVLFASYGTSREEARAASIAPVAETLREGLGCAVAGEAADADDTGVAAARSANAIARPAFAEAYTSAKARRVLARRGVRVPDVSEALHELARAGARRVLVQPGHLVHGTAFAQVERAVASCRFLFSCIALGEPLLSSEGDLARIAQILGARYPRRPGEALVLVAHGVDEGSAATGSTYASLALHLRELGRDDAFVGSMHGYPGVDTVRRLLALDRERLGITRVRLVPLMLTAAAHASRDIAGEAPGSWRTALAAEGYDVSCELEGLGALPAVRELYLDHARAALRALEPEPAEPDASAAPTHTKFPLFRDLSGTRCIVVGLGSVGLRRARMLARFGAKVTAIDPSPAEARAREAGETGIALERREWLPADVEGVSLVVAATDCRPVNSAIARACSRTHVPVSVADNAEESTCFFPAVCETERLVAGIVSDGHDHELVARAAAEVRTALREVDRA